MSAPNVVTRGFQPSGTINLVVTQGYAQFAHITPPPIPPVTPTGAVGGGGYPDYCSPYERECRRKAKEYMERVAFGILPPPEEPVIDLPVRVEKFIQKKIEAKLPGRITVRLNKEKIVESVVKDTLKAFYKERQERFEREIEEEEDDVIFISLLH